MAVIFHGLLIECLSSLIVGLELSADGPQTCYTVAEEGIFV